MQEEIKNQNEKKETRRDGYGPNGCLIAANMRTPEERAENGRKGGLKAQENNRKRRTAQEIMQMLLDCTISKTQAREKLGEYAEFLPEEGATLADLVNLRQIIEAAEGSTKAAEFVRDTSGDKPVERQEINAEIMSDADRELMQQIKKRLEGSGQD